MNYFLVPKNNNELNIFLKHNDKIFISHTCLYYYKTLKQIVNSIDPDIISLLNIPTVKYSYNIFNLIEIISTFFIFNFDFNITIYSLQNIDVIISIFRKSFHDNIISDPTTSFDLGFFYIKEENYQNIKTIMNHILFKQKKNGSIIIKINSTFLQHTLDFIFVLSTIYDKVFILKPKISNYIHLERYIVCKGFLTDFKSKTIQCTFNHKPFHFIKKMEEINSIIMNNQCKMIYSFIDKLNNTNKEILENMNTLKYIEWASTFLPDNII